MMEQLNSKLYDKYKNLKKRKGYEEEEWNSKRDSDFRKYQLATEGMIEDLKNENNRLREEIFCMQDKYAECQKLLLEESRKTKELSNEVGRLQNLSLHTNGNNESPHMKSPYTSPEVRSRATSKGSPRKKTSNSCTRHNEVQYIEAAIIPYNSCQEEQIMPDCCRRNMSSSGDATGKGSTSCVFHTLIEFLVGMNFSVDSQAEGFCLSVIHQRSGYTFSLTWTGNKDGREGELMYHVSSLGTLERVALEWMREDMVFSMTMCPVFFERISRVIGLR